MRYILLCVAVVGGFLLINPQNIAAQEISPGQSQRVETIPPDVGESDNPNGTHLKRASELVLIGIPVKTTDGEDVGKVEDLILDGRTGTVEYVVVATSGLIGAQEKLVAVPAVAFAFPGSSKTLVVAVSKQKLEAAPSFRKDQWPQLADGQWKASVDGYYLAQLSRSERAPATGQPATF